MVLCRPRGLACSCLLAGVAACNALTGADQLGSTDRDIQLPGRETQGGELEGSDDTTDVEPTHGRSSSRGGDASTEGDGSPGTFDATTAPPGFVDLFDRPDGPTIGNGWMEKQDRFSLANGTVIQSGEGSYIDFIVRRPPSEPALDVEVSIDFVYGQNIEVDPSLYVRMQPNSDQARTLSGYVFYAFRDGAGIDREDGQDYAELVGGEINPPLAVGQTYHYVFRVRGTSPVALEAAITKDGTVVKSFSTSDNAAQRVTAAGQIGFGAGRSDGGRWDNFRRVDL